MQAPLVSIIIPIYKVEPYLHRCLKSVINQTYTNLEIILVDDGSPDNCPVICDNYATNNNRIIVIHKENGGLSDARNTGIVKATGTYVYFLDSDDELPLDAIKTMIDYAHLYPQAEIITGNMFCPQNKDLYKTQHFDNFFILENNIEFRNLFSNSNDAFPVNACNKLIKRDFITSNQLFFEKGIIHEDQLWAFLVSKVVNKAVCISEITYIRHLNPNSIMTSSSKDQRNISWSKILELIFLKIDQPVFAKQFFKYFILLNFFYKQTNSIASNAFNKAWTNCIDCTKKNGHPLLGIIVYCHKLLFKILKGHGTGFIIWFILTKTHIKNQ